MDKLVEEAVNKLLAEYPNALKCLPSGKVNFIL
jgi:hypothetical protein